MIQQLRLFKVERARAILLISDGRNNTPLKACSNVTKAYNFLISENCELYNIGTEPNTVGRKLSSYASLMRRINEHGHIKLVRQKAGGRPQYVIVQKMILN